MCAGTKSVSPLPIPLTEARINALNVVNKPDEDGVVRGSVLPPGQRQSLLSYIIAIPTLVLFISWPYIYVTIVLLSPFSRVALVLALLLAATLLLPAKLLWHKFTRSYVMLTWGEYFNFSWTCEEMHNDVGKNVIFAEFPHGAFPLGPILAAGPCAIYCPGHEVYALAASAVFYVPLYKHFMSYLGALPASRSNLAALLRKGSVAVTMGGIAEMFMLRDDREEVMLRSRKGLMKTAIETGSPVVPVYHLGNSRVLRFGPSFLKYLSRRLRTSIGITIGKWGLPIPIQHPINMVTGKAIHPEKLKLEPGQEGYEEEMRQAVERLTNILADEIQALYERHRGVIPGWEKRPLIVH